MEFRSRRLENGLEIVAECNPDAYSAALGFFVNTGSRDETDAISGVSHFLEHMAFKGSATRSADDVNREFDEMGADYNACTTEESTIFYAAVLPEQIERTVGLLGDLLRPALRVDDFATEKQVILEEIRMYEDQPPFGADDKCRAAHFGAHPLGRSVLGTVASVSRLSAEAMRAYFHRRYTPGNIVLVGAGRIDFEAIVAYARQTCGDWEAGRADRAISPPPHHDGFHLLRKETAAQQYVMHLVPGPSATDPDRYAAKLLTCILGDDSGSRLYWELVDPGLVEHAGVYHAEYDGAGVLATSMSCDPEDAKENLQHLLHVYREAEQGGITAAELDQAKNKVASRLVLSGERPRGRLFLVGGDWIQRRQYHSIRDDLNAVAAITLDEVNAVLAKYPLSRGTTVTIGPLADWAPEKT
ncbi:MAG: M16 family metallopeptidase [Thermoguttaceae bacterium]